MDASRRRVAGVSLRYKKPASVIAREVKADTTTVIRWLKVSSVSYRTYLEAKRLQGEGIRQGTSERATRAQAEKLLLRAGVPKRCARCGTEEGWIEIHHLDEDYTNNVLENLQWLCRSCHMSVHFGWIVRSQILEARGSYD